MDTKFFTPNQIDQAAQAIRKGELIAFPTETVYGLGADATNEAAVKKVYLAKGRPSDNPLIVHIDSLERVIPFVDNFSGKMAKLAEHFWPGPLTMVLPVKKGSISASVTGGLSTAGFRMPNNTVTRQLIAKAGVPIVGPSANSSGKPSPTTASHVYHDLNGKIEGILDDGPATVGLESTVIDLSGDIPLILRPGVITKSQIEAVVGKVEYDQHLVKESETPKSPGMKYKHYSPDVEVQMIDAQKENWQEAIRYAKNQNKLIGLIADASILKRFQTQVDATYSLGEEHQMDQAMQHLFAGLRALDEKVPQLDIVYVQTFSEEEAGLAYMNRLKKAAAQNFF